MGTGPADALTGLLILTISGGPSRVRYLTGQPGSVTADCQTLAHEFRPPPPVASTGPPNSRHQPYRAAPSLPPDSSASMAEERLAHAATSSGRTPAPTAPSATSLAASCN